MVYQHRLQESRYELKYIIAEHRAAEVRDFIRSYLVPDEHADPQAGNSYPVQSLYLDSPALDLFRGTICGLRNRLKLRIRFYDDDPAHPVFFEIKRRLSDVIQKERACVRREAVGLLLRGIRPGATFLASPDNRAKSAAALQTIYRTSLELNARGTAYICYRREAYVSPDSDQLRVTFDRGITAARYTATPYLVTPKATVPIDMRDVVLEIKFTDRFPNWLRQMVHAMNLWRCPMAKYIAGIRTIGYPWIERIGMDSGVAL
ncbi:MAG: polyphosphate polymerase domain-containing protein [Pirellulales bacterium]|nr:polyphosphate polymerase domain-containing protein [Pirellulales bacterium]